MGGTCRNYVLKTVAPLAASYVPQLMKDVFCATVYRCDAVTGTDTDEHSCESQTH